MEQEKEILKVKVLICIIEDAIEIKKNDGTMMRKQTIVGETTDQAYKHTIAFDVLGDKVDVSNVHENNTYVVSYNLESRKYNDRWYNGITAWKFEYVQEAAPTQVAQPATSAPAAAPQPEFDTTSDDESGLPF